MVDRALPAQRPPIVFRETPNRRDVIITRHPGGAFRDYLRRFLRLLNRLIEAGGPMS